MEQTAVAFHPNLIIYFAHKNDLDESLQVHDFFSWSHVLLRIRLIYNQIWVKPEQKRLRKSPERQALFVGEVERIVQFCKTNRIPLLIALLHGQLENTIREQGQALMNEAMHHSATWDPLASVQIILVKPWVKQYSKVDHHYSSEAYHHLAKNLCAFIAASPSGTCTPPNWGTIN